MARAKKGLVAIMGYHEGNAGQVFEWFEAVSGLKVAAFFEEGDAPPSIDPRAENEKRVSQRMEYPTATRFKGRPFFVRRDWPQKLKALGVTAVLPLSSDNKAREAGIARCREAGFSLASAVHPTALVLDQALIEPGVWINAGAVVGYKAEIRAGVMLNTGTRVDHHSILESCCQLDPGVTTAGHVTVRPRAQVHTGAVIINRIVIGEDAVVGAGAVVLHDVPPRAVVVGVPARVLR